MKYSYATLAIVVAVAQAQTIADIPPCAISCFTTVLANTPCETLTDLACQCRQSQLLPDLAPCVASSCSPAEAEGVRTAAQSLCASVGVNVEVPAEGGAPAEGGEDEVTPPPATTAEEPAPQETVEQPAEETVEQPAEDTTEETTTIQTQTTVQTTSTATATETAEETEETAETVNTAQQTYVYPSAPGEATTVATTVASTGVTRPTGAVNATTSVVAPFTGAANQVAVGPIGGLLVFIVAAVYAI